MKLEIKQNILLEHLNYVIRGISTKNLRPILNCIKFELTDEGLYLMSTDGDISIKTFIDKKEIKKIDSKGEIVVSGRYIYEIIRKLPNEIINLEEVIDSKLYINTTNSSFTLNCSNVNEFPDLELEFNQNPIILNQKLFKTIINQTSFATSVSETRPVLTGINFKIEENNLECTATDSYRLAKKEIRLSVSSNKKVDLDYVREKAYGDLASEITESIHEEVHDVEDKEKDSLLEDNLLYDLSEEESPAVKVVTVGDAEEYFNDLGLEYNVDYKVEKEVRDEEEKKSDKVVTRRVDRKKNELLNENDSLDVEEVTDEVKDKNNEDSNLFDLIDSMYEDKE